VTFAVDFKGKATGPGGEKVYGFEAETKIDREEFGLLWNEVLETGGVLVGQEVFIKLDLEIYQEISVTQPTNVKNKLPRQVQQTRKKPTDFHQLIIENMRDLVLLIEPSGEVKYCNPSLTTMLGYEQSSFKHRDFYSKIHPEDQQTVKEQIVTYANRTIKSAFNIEFRLRHQQGHYVNIEADIIYTEDNDLIQLVLQDISEQKEAEKAIYELAFYDTLTKLPNRRSFLNQLRNEVLEGNHTQSNLSVLFIDLDDFKPINDNFGHDAGDEALKEAAKRIQSVIRPTDIAARYGGDEFVVLLKDIPNKEQVITIAKRLLEQFNEPINKLNHGYTLTPSIGVAHFPDHGTSPEELIKNADTAHNHVKERGKNDFLIFNEKMEDQSLERRILENSLRLGLKDEQFFLVYQPKVNITTNKIIGMEALVRWEHPDLGIIPPLKFIPLAEETGLIVPLGEWILRESCRQAVEWKDTDYPSLNVSVNISVRQLEDVNFIQMVRDILQETGLDPTRLELEITESVLANVKSTVAILKEIRKLGVQISVDDFGTGYSSLSYIKDLPIDTIKIDQSFIKDIHENKESKEIAKALINLADSIGLNAIAEGIEQKEHVKELKEEGYSLGQGYYYSKPLKPKQFEDLMKRSVEANC